MFGEFYELGNGCICCSVKDDLVSTLETLMTRRWVNTDWRRGLSQHHAGIVFLTPIIPTAVITETGSITLLSKQRAWRTQVPSRPSFGWTTR